MRLTNCVFIEDINAEEEKQLTLVLQTTKSVMALTQSLPTLAWHFKDNTLSVFGPDNELDIARLALRNSLGLIPDGSAVDRQDSPFDLAPTTTNVDTGAFTNGWTDEEIAHHQEEYARVNGYAQNSLRRIGCPTPLLSNGNPDEARRETMVNEIIELSQTFLLNPFLDNDIRVEWQTEFNRLTDAPIPTVSSTGSFTAQEQIDYHLKHNPQNWNLVKTRFNGSRYYLSYLCPPSVDMATTLRVCGGRNADRVPEQFEICVYNTEPYWRELRHLMHREAPYLREAVAA